MSRALGAPIGAAESEAKNASSAEADKALSSHNLESSRGGTRTRDPGIMSAVL